MGWLVEFWEIYGPLDYDVLLILPLEVLNCKQQVDRRECALLWAIQLCQKLYVRAVHKQS